MKVFFCASPRFKEKNEENIKKIHNALEELGCQHTSDFIVDVVIGKFYSAGQEEVMKNYKGMVNGIKNADVAVFEVSLPSLAMGYLVSLALEHGKPVVLLHMKDSSPFLFAHIQNEKLILAPYNLDNLKEVLKGAIEDAKEIMDVRFNFFISPKIGAYLDWIAKHKKLPRAVFLRRLIEEHMSKNKDYNKA